MKQKIKNQRIIIDPKILAGKPIIAGTRISVEIVLTALAKNPDVNELFAAHPRLTTDDVKAALNYAKELVSEESVYPIN